MKERRRLGRLLSQVVAPVACAAEQGEGWTEYRDKAVKRALELGNRGPIRFDADGRLAQDIQDAYWRTGFYVFEKVLSKEEVADLNADFDACEENAPVTRRGKIDKHGRSVKFPDLYNMTDPETDDHELTVAQVHHPLQVMDSCLRLYGHPQILKIAETFNGPDFVPFTENIFHKERGVGPATNWHQDGRTHWRRTSPEGIVAPEDLGCHGFSFHGAFSRSTPENGLWVLPGSHRRKHPDALANVLRIGASGEALGTAPKLVVAHGEIYRLPEAVPMLMNPGDVGMHNRSCLHGSFPNKTEERRLTMQFGFHNRRFVVGTKARNLCCGRPFLITYDEAYAQGRARMIQVAIDARRQKYPDETPYVYKPFVGNEEALRFNEQTREEVVKGYHRNERDGVVVTGDIFL